MDFAVSIMLCEEERPVICNASRAWLCVSDSVVGILRASTMMEPSTSTSSARKVRFFLWLCFPSLFAILPAPLSTHCSWSHVSISCLYVGSSTGLCATIFPLLCFVFLVSNRFPVRVCHGLACLWFSFYCVGFLFTVLRLPGFQLSPVRVWRAFGLPSAILGFSSQLWFPSNGEGSLGCPVKPYLIFPLLLADLWRCRPVSGACLDIYHPCTWHFYDA